MYTLALIAGGGNFPILFSQIARKKGEKILAVGIKGDTKNILKRYADGICWVDVTEFSRIFKILEDRKIKRVVMAGQVNPQHLFNKREDFDPLAKELLDNLQDKKANTIFSTIVEKLNSKGIEVLDSTTYLSNFLPQKGVLTKRHPTFGEWEDIYLGEKTARAMGILDIGQAVCVKEKCILAVEAFEGTDETIKRAAGIGGEKIVVVKMARPFQDMRFDIPVIGLRTITILAKVKAACLAIEAEKTLFLDKERAISLADKKGVCIVSI